MNLVYGPVEAKLQPGRQTYVQGTVLGEVQSVSGPSLLRYKLLQQQADGTFEAIDVSDQVKVSLVCIVQSRHLAKQRQQQ